ncbi:MAG: DUF4091 domain-containing protein [Bacteroidaceae bacterium]|nr:DUF4091 domain-containing protein [Bacteroidaceae bacterium]
MKLTRKFFLLLLAAAPLVGCKEYTPVETFTEPEDPTPLTEEAQAAWEKVSKKLNGAWGNINQRYSRSEVPQTLGTEKLHISAWKGEKASAQALLWTAKGANGVECQIKDFKTDGASMPASIAQARFVRYTIADQNTPNFKKGAPHIIVPDMLDTLSRFDMAAQTTRPVWITINVPQNAKAGIYTSEVEISHNGFGKVCLPLEIEVIDRTLNTPDKWAYHLDLWQHPSSVARAQGLEMWSDAHFEAMKPLMKMLANAGQKVITVNVNKDPWNHQCYDAYEDMIKWTLKADGTWSYDYKVFDRWVKMMLSVGINRMINCYSMVPWNCELDYFDEKENKKITVVAEPGKPIFEKIWEPFLKDFKQHLSEKGWLDITNIAMDERAPEAMDAAVKVLEKCAPEMGFALADNHHSYKRYTMMRDVCVAMQQKTDQEDITSRREKGFNTTFYICCGPYFPNTFTFSHPFEAELLGWYGLAWDFDGMLRWAYNSWQENPVIDSRFGNWSSGDTYLVYPYCRSSIRFERLIDGIEAAEKTRALRAEGKDISELEKVLEEIRNMNANDSKQPWQDIVEKAGKTLNEVSR